VFIILAMWACVTTSAAAADTEFEKGNELYEKGQFAAAAAAYEKLLKSGEISPSIYFNLGNALFKSGQLGRAIVNYRLADLLAPRDPDIRANLQFARNTVQGGSAVSVLWWQRAVQRLTLNEWTMFAATALWIWFLLLALGRLRPSWSGRLRRPAVFAGAAFVVTAICLALAWNSRFGVRWAVVVTPEAVVRNGPLDESPTYFVVRDGAELQVLDSKADWLQVTDAARRTGWLRRQQVALVGDG
jgi:tetratricopeptide (TPR) repeat protein